MDTQRLNDLLARLDRGEAIDPAEAAEAVQQVPALAARLAGRRPDAFYPPEKPAAGPTTDTAIDTFLDRYGHGSSAEEDALIERLIFNPQPDYAAWLEEHEPAPAVETPASDPGMDAIERFLGRDASQDLGARLKAEDEAAATASEAPQTAAPKPFVPHAPNPDAPLQLSMARLLISQGQYAKARDMMRVMENNLQGTQKSRYFAVQMRFLDALVANDERLRAARDTSENQS